MARTIFTVGIEIPSAGSMYVPLDEVRSLLDADLIVFRPGAKPFMPRRPNYRQGKPSLGESGSATFKRACKHWQRELRVAMTTGRTVIVILSEPQDVLVDTGRRETQKVGRRRVSQRVVAPCSSYELLPFTVEAVATTGTAIRPTSDLGVVADLWATFSGHFSYEAYITTELSTPLFTTKRGERVLGGWAPAANGGSALLLPYLDFERNDYLEECEDEDGDTAEQWTTEGLQAGARFVAALARLDDALRAPPTSSPRPEWVSAAQYRIPTEDRLHTEVEELDKRLSKLRVKRQELQDELADEQRLHALLYGTGKELESVTRRVLETMGFTAEPYDDGESEFDVVFVSEEGRFLGEVEGKDKKPVNISKFRQLEGNIQEDLAREDVDEPAHAVLFGNAHRLTPPDERGQFFTDKCLKAAKRSGVSLVRTPDLFTVAQRLRKGPDTEYADSCRQAIVAGAGGIVEFP